MSQPIYAFLRGIGNVTDRRGKLIHMIDRNLLLCPEGKYIMLLTCVDSHNLFEKLPSLGLSANMLIMLMVMAFAQDESVPNIPVFPANTKPHRVSRNIITSTT